MILAMTIGTMMERGKLRRTSRKQSGTGVEKYNQAWKGRHAILWFNR